jgi:hypothetical protein
MEAQGPCRGFWQKMTGPNEKLAPKQEAAILALLSSRGIEEAAKSIQIPPRTLYRWLNDPEFDRAYRRAKRSVFGQAISRLQQGRPLPRPQC